MRGLATIQRRDQRLNDARRSVSGARIAPRFQVMRFRNMPVAQRRGFIVVEAEMDAQSHFPKTRTELQVRRRGVDRVAADDHKQYDAASIHILDQLAQRLRLVNRIGFNGISIDYRGSHVAQSLVQRVCQRVDSGRLLISGNNEARAPMPLQVAHERGQPLSGDWRLGIGGEFDPRLRTPDSGLRTSDSQLA